MKNVFKYPDYYLDDTYTSIQADDNFHTFTLPWSGVRVNFYIWVIDTETLRTSEMRSRNTVYTG